MIVADSRYIAEDAIRDVVVEIEPIDAVVDLEKGLLPRRAAGSRASAVECCGARRAAEGRLRDARAGTPALIIKRRFLYDRGVSAPIENRAVAVDWDAQGRRADHLGHHAGADSDPQRPGEDAGAARIAGERDRAVRGRRVRSEDHDVLSGRAAAAVGGDAAQSAAEVDRGPPGEFLRHHAGARADARRGDGAHQGRPHPRRARRLPVRYRRVRSLRTDDPDQQPVHPAWALRHSALRERVHRRLHEQDDRDAGAEAPAGSTASS